MTFEDLTEQLASDVRSINGANMRLGPRSPPLLEPRKRTPQSRWSASRGTPLLVSLAASQCDGFEICKNPYNAKHQRRYLRTRGHRVTPLASHSCRTPVNGSPGLADRGS